MLLLLSLCVCGLLLGGDAQDRAALWRGNDRAGRCLYTFSVPSPVESSCPQAGGPELEALKARLSVLEALVSKLAGGESPAAPHRPGPAAPDQAQLQQALDRAVAEKNLLRGEKQQLERELEVLQRRMEEMRKETEKLRNKPCPPQTPVGPANPSLQNGGLMRPAGGKRYTTGLDHCRTAVIQDRKSAPYVTLKPAII